MNSHFSIQIKKLSKYYHSQGNQIDILQDVTFNIKKGETIAIVGASGIGKSTLLNIIGTLDRPSEGEIYIQGENVFSLSETKIASFRNKSIGFVFQFHHLLPEFNALENVMIPLLIDGISKRKAKTQGIELLEKVGLKDRLLHRTGELSGGEQQRVAVARALIHHPELLLADEPTGNLDRKNSEQVHDLLMKLNQEYNMTMLVVTHNKALADCMARRITLHEKTLVDVDKYEGFI